jgi:hypothetical protein
MQSWYLHAGRETSRQACAPCITLNVRAPQPYALQGAAEVEDETEDTLVRQHCICADGL